MKNVAHKSCIEARNMHFMLNTFFFENRAIYEIVWKKYGRARRDTGNNIIQRMRFVCWITKAEYVLLIAFPRQKWLRERASMLRCSTLSYFSISWGMSRYTSE
jgi:hypothetical protein